MAGKMVAKSFEDLEVFQRAYRLSLDIHRVSLRLPAIEQRALGDQIRRASKSIPVNIAEGFGKQVDSVAEFRRFLRIAMGSADEMRVWVRYALDLGYVDEATWRRWRDEYHAVAKMIQGLHAKSVVRRSKRTSSDP
jgi:four helix bundle protein